MSIGCSRCACAAAARLRTAPPTPTRRGPDDRQPVQRPRAPRARASADPVQLLLLRRPRAREKLLGHADRPEPERRDPARVAVTDLDQLEAAATEVEHHAVGEHRRVDRRHVAEVGLVPRRQRLDRQPGRSLGLFAELLAVGGLADRAGRDHVDVLGRDQAVGAAEALEYGQRLHPTRDRRFTELPRGAEAGTDSDRLIELVGALPPRARSVGEDDQAPRVRAEIDHRDLLADGATLARGPGGAPAHGRTGPIRRTPRPARRVSRRRLSTLHHARPGGRPDLRADGAASRARQCRAGSAARGSR